MIDYGQVMPAGGVIMFPEVPLPAQPLQPEQIVETNYVTGTATTCVNVGGSVDSPS